MDPKKVKVHVKATEEVVYDVVIDMEEDDANALMSGVDEGEAARILGDYLMMDDFTSSSGLWLVGIEPYIEQEDRG